MMCYNWFTICVLYSGYLLIKELRLQDKYVHFELKRQRQDHVVFLALVLHNTDAALSRTSFASNPRFHPSMFPSM